MGITLFEYEVWYCPFGERNHVYVHVVAPTVLAAVRAFVCETGSEDFNIKLGTRRLIVAPECFSEYAKLNPAKAGT